MKVCICQCVYSKTALPSRNELSRASAQRVGAAHLNECTGTRRRPHRGQHSGRAKISDPPSRRQWCCTPILQPFLRLICSGSLASFRWHRLAYHLQPHTMGVGGAGAGKGRGAARRNINHFVPFEVRLTHGTEACPPHARRQACTIRVRACPDLSHCARVP